jgi:starch-binding outer membrane protein, SusD/RagB family
MKNLKFKIVMLAITLIVLNSCSEELNTKPEIEDSIENLLKKDPNAINGLVSRLYAGLSLTSAKGAGESDLDGPDKGETGFLRGILNLEDFAADCMKNRWGDDGLDQLTTSSDWTSTNKFFRYFYDRVYITVPNCNNIIKAINNTNIPNKDASISELRFIRSLAYFYMIDCFGKGVIATEDDLGSTSLKPEASRLEMFNYLEKELLEIEPTIAESNGYGRANKNVVRMLLAKLYLNAAVYTGTPRFNEAAIYTKKVIDGGYSLAPDYNSLFEADNNETLAKNEIIFPLICDSEVTQSYSNTTYLVNGSILNTTMVPANYGVLLNGWGGHRTSKALYSLWGATATAVNTNPDVRASGIWTTGHSYEMTNYKTWSDGFPYAKFKNKKSINPSPTLVVFSSTDFPLYRLGDAYLMYAECALRGASSADMSTALGYVNALRTRANAPQITNSQMTLQFILDERAKELTMEGHRRTDLIRFGKFTGGTYLWPWKGGTLNGTTIPDSYNLYPIPLTAIQSNNNLKQNPGY